MGKNKKEGVEKPKIHINLNPSIPALPRVKDKTQIDVRYALIPPFAYAHIYWDKKNSDLMYEVEEPKLSENDQSNLEKIEKSMREVVNINVLIEKSTESKIKYVDKTMQLLISELNLKINPDSYKKIFYYLFRNFVGLEKVEPLIKDFFIEDIECNGTETPVYIVHRVFRNMKTNVVYKKIDNLESFVEKLAQKCGKYVSYASPLLDGSLPDGSRINATYSQDITSKGPTFTIRKFTSVPWTPTQLLQFNTLSPEMLAYFWLLIQYKCNILLAGGTASGKTTMLNALAFFMPPEDRVVSIEDTREINLARENWLPSVSRTSIGTGKVGEVDLFTLLKSSFRQNPEYVIVGEVRGKEAFVLFQGMASGHASLSTLHADSVDTVIKRLETPPIELSPTLVNTLDAVAVMSHVIVNKKATRKMNKITEIVKVESDGTALTNTPFVWSPREDRFYFNKNTKVFEKIAERNGLTNKEIQDEFNKRARLLFAMYQKGVFQFEQVQKEINEYYKNPEPVLKKYGIIQ